MTPVKFGIVGIGGYGRTHIRAVEELEQEGIARLDAAVVIDPENHPEKLAEFASRDVRVYDTLDGLLEAGGVDWITLPIGIHYHVPLSIACLEAGFNVICEKPLTSTIQNAHQLIDVRNRTGKTVLVGYQSVYSAAIQTIKSHILEGKLGKVKSIRIHGGWPRHNFYYHRNPWAGKLKVGDEWVLDSPINNAMAHDVNGAFHLCGPTQHESAMPVTVQAELYRARNIETLDTACLRARTHNGVDIVITLSHATKDKFDPVTVLHAEKGTVTWSRKSATIFYANGKEEPLGSDNSNKRGAFGNAIDITQNNAPAMCAPEVAIAQTLCINGAHESCPDIVPFPPDLIETVEEDTSDGLATFYYVRGLDELMHQCAKEGRLFSELDAKWAVQTRPFDLTGYDRFSLK
ncbi:MAG: Gfo/Idh/MocA family oxidoreductase [bacterium]|nr:Gfo/Idh/MocA family oxidoreductase [bacterium]